MTKYQFLLFPSSTPSGWTSTPTIWSILRKANGKCHWLFALVKTTWLEHLLPPELRAYSCKMANSTQLNKDERLRIAEYGLIALDEIDAMGPRGWIVRERGLEEVNANRNIEGRG